MKTFKVYLRSGQNFIFNAENIDLTVKNDTVQDFFVTGGREERPLYVNGKEIEAITVTDYA